MKVGVGRVTLRLEGVGSLKAKRSIVRRIVERSRRFNASVAEVARQDDLRSAMIGFSVVSSSREHAQTMVDEVMAFIIGLRLAVVVERSSEILSLNDREQSADVALRWADFEEDA